MSMPLQLELGYIITICRYNCYPTSHLLHLTS
jgi:hypothetical protein